MKLETRVKMPKFILNRDRLQKICVSSLHDTRLPVIQTLDNYTLRATGALRTLKIVVNTDTGLSIEYGVPYVDYVYHNPKIKNVTTPGTTAYWDDAAFSSGAFSQYTENTLSDVIASRLNKSLDVFIKK